MSRYELHGIKYYFLLFAFLLSSHPVLAAVNINLGEFAVSYPQINTTYTKPVQIDVATLTFQGQFPITYPLCVKPTTFATEFDMSPRQGGTPGSCTEPFESLQPGQYLLTISARDVNSLPSQASPQSRR